MESMVIYVVLPFFFGLSSLLVLGFEGLLNWDCWSLVCDHAQGREHIITLMKVKAHTTLEYPQDPFLTAGNAAADKEARMCAKSAQSS